jgi:vancomycin resistance protein VanJ
MALPLTLLVTFAAWLQPRWSASALAVGVAAFAGCLGYVIPWGVMLSGGGRDRPTLRLLTCNVQYKDLDAKALADLVREERPDVVLLQECDLDDPREVLGGGDWHVRSEGEFCVASRYPIVGYEVLGPPDKAYRRIAVRVKVLWRGMAVSVVAAHLMSPRKGLEEVIRSSFRSPGTFREVLAVQRLESGLLRRWVGNGDEPTLVAGDFNLTVEHPLYRHDWSDFTNAFSRAGWGLGHTMFTRHIGLRIDHVVCGWGWRPTGSRVGPEVGSAHRPVVAELAWEG